MLCYLERNLRLFNRFYSLYFGIKQGINYTRKNDTFLNYTVAGAISAAPFLLNSFMKKNILFMIVILGMDFVNEFSRKKVNK